jgi:SAM-dependent methyltransferase
MKIREKLNQLKTSLGLEPRPLPKIEEPVKKKEVVPPDLELTPAQLYKDPIEEKPEPAPTPKPAPAPEPETPKAVDLDSLLGDQPEVDEGYLQYSSEVVGFENRELQWNAYRTVLSYIDSNNILDFGCGRGDMYSFSKTDPDFNSEPLVYTGVDMNDQMIKMGKEIHEDINLINSDWFNLSEDIIADWAVNAGSCNLRYDADIVTTDEEYTKKTITAMYDHCTKGVILLLASSLIDVEDGLVNHNPGSIFNWAQQEFGNVALDHSVGDDVFCLIIYK